jgi:hypothetical protein
VSGTEYNRINKARTWDRLRSDGERFITYSAIFLFSIYLYTYIPPTLYPQKGSRGIHFRFDTFHKLLSYKDYYIQITSCLIIHGDITSFDFYKVYWLPLPYQYEQWTWLELWMKQQIFIVFSELIPVKENINKYWFSTICKNFKYYKTTTLYNFTTHCKLQSRQNC